MSLFRFHLQCRIQFLVNVIEHRNASITTRKKAKLWEEVIRESSTISNDNCVQSELFIILELREKRTSTLNELIDKIAQETAIYAMQNRVQI